MNRTFFNSFFVFMQISISPFALAAKDNTFNTVLATVEQAAGRVDFYDSKSHLKLGGTSIGFIPHEITLSNENHLAYVSNFGLQDYDETIGIPGDTISIIDTNTYKEIGTLSTGHENGPHGLKLRPNHPDELYVNTEIDNQIIIFDLKTHKIKKQFPSIKGTHNFIFSPDGDILWLMASESGVIKLNAETGEVLGEYHAESPIRGIEYTPSKKEIMVASTNQISFFDPTSLTTTRSIENLGVNQILYAAISPDEKTIVAPAVWNNETLLIDVDSAKVIKRFVTGLDPVHALIDDEGQYAYITNARSSHITKIDLKKHTIDAIDTEAGPNGIALFKQSGVPSQEPKPTRMVTLGAILPLTGKDKDIGRNIMLGYEFWRDYVNGHGGIKIADRMEKVAIYYEDSQSNDDSIKQHLQDLTSAHNINLLLGSFDNVFNNLYHEMNLPVQRFLAKLNNYLNLPKELYMPFLDENNLKDTYQKAMNLSMTEITERGYFTTKLIEKTLSNDLYLPNDDGMKHPGVILLHTSAGITQTDRDWANILYNQGYAVLLVDSFTSRGYVDRKSVGWEKSYQAQLDDLKDAYLMLTTPKEIDSKRIALIGYSLGGYSTLRAMELNTEGKPYFNIPFKLAASFYGHAQRFGATQFKGLISLFVGDDDDRSPLQSFLTLKDTANQSNITLFHYPHAKHGFDNPYLPESMEVTDENGMTYHLGYNLDAHSQSISDLLGFLKNL